MHSDPDYLGVATRVNQLARYAQAAAALEVAVPSEPLRSARLIDGRLWNGLDPAGYARDFAIAYRAPAQEPA